jgi:hypothetical protein
VVTVYDNGHPAGTATVVGGWWSATVILGAGIHAVTASQSVPGSPPHGPPPGPFTSAQSPALAVVVTTSGGTSTLLPYTQPAAPAITAVSTPAPTKGPAQVTVSGTGIAGDTIVVSDGGAPIATTNVGHDGTWSVKVQLSVGPHSLTAVQQVVAGAASASSAPAAVTVFAPTPAPSLWEPPQSVAAGAAFTVVGSGVAGDTITLYDGTTSVGTTTVAADGSWSVTLALATGRHTLAATQSDPGSHLVSGQSGREEVDAYAVPAAAPITVVTPGHGPSSTFLVSGTGVVGDTVTVYDGSTPVGSAVIGKNGTWSVNVRLASGTHTLSTTQTVGSFVTGPAGAAVTVTV